MVWFLILWAYQVSSSTGQSSSLDPQVLVQPLFQASHWSQWRQNYYKSQRSDRLKVQPAGRVWQSRWRSRSGSGSSHD